MYSDDDKLEVKPYNISDSANLFTKFIKDYGKTYKTDEEFYKRYNIFVKNLDDINKLNSEGGTASYDINQFADMEEVEMDSGGFN